MGVLASESSIDGIATSEKMSSCFENSVDHGPALDGTGISEANNVEGRVVAWAWKFWRFSRGRLAR